METLHNTSAEFLPASCDFIVDNLNSKLKSSLDSVAPLLTKTIKTKPTTPWRNDEIKKLRRNCRSAERKWRKTDSSLRNTSHFPRLITDHKNNPKILFSTINLSINVDFNKSSRVPADALCKDFADHFGNKTDVIRFSLLLQQNAVFNTFEEYLRKHWRVLSWLM